MKEKIDVYYAGDAVGSVLPHLRGHPKLGEDFTRCGHPLGRRVSDTVAVGRPVCRGCTASGVKKDHMPRLRQHAENMVAIIQGREPFDLSQRRTLRDEFAMQSIVGITGYLDADIAFQEKSCHEIARRAYAVADAMLEARKEK